jgi:hypothetical protein
MRLPWHKRVVASVDPRRPHEFVARTDGGISALAPLGGGMGRQVSDIASAGAYTRTAGCGVPGCGKPSDDLIHAPAER